MKELSLMPESVQPQRERGLADAVESRPLRNAHITGEEPLYLLSMQVSMHFRIHSVSFNLMTEGNCGVFYVELLDTVIMVLTLYSGKFI